MCRPSLRGIYKVRLTSWTPHSHTHTHTAANPLQGHKRILVCGDATGVEVKFNQASVKPQTLWTVPTGSWKMRREENKSVLRSYRSGRVDIRLEVPQQGLQGHCCPPVQSNSRNVVNTLRDIKHWHLRQNSAQWPTGPDQSPSPAAETHRPGIEPSLVADTVH